MEIRRDVAWIGNPSARSVYEYRRSNGSWTLVITLSDPNQRYFGGTVQLRGERNLYVVDGGAVNLYSRSAGVWTRRATFMAADGLFPDPFSEEAMDSQGRWLGAVFSGRGYILDAAAVLVR